MEERRLVAGSRYWPSYFKGTEIMKRRRSCRHCCANTDIEGFKDFTPKTFASTFREACCKITLSTKAGRARATFSHLWIKVDERKNSLGSSLFFM